ncbi:CapA family protein [Bacillus sp. FJAT-29790]|uniref:CapA family protein n=1 Tax=Bacillus sp. FJAT-29790 TaxID=1895002 RepID=UPI001C243156|nr:CapA family protein [Bacillus sp. FJAT-29790]MBU8878587.1 CapA family protein [Bacillus sp. FJAT-29790]
MKKNKSLLFSSFLCLGLILLSSFLIFKMYKETEQTEMAFKPIQTHEGRHAVLSSKSFRETITLGAIGDILIHDWLYNDAKTTTGYDFNPMFQHIKTMLHQPDLLLANQETILGGTALGISSYPLFNSPQEVGDALLSAGVDLVSTANNHSLDKGEIGLLASIDYMDKIGLPHVGTFRDSQDKQSLLILNKNGIKVAYLSYTYGTNGILVPQGKEYLVNLIDKVAMKEEIHRAKVGADVIVMSLHWGNEYQRFPTDEQRQLAQFLVNEGIDILFGHHPHVLQPMEWLKAADGRKSLVVYSLGNFLSGQNWDYKDIGGMATVEVTKIIDEDGVQIELGNPDFFPTYVAQQNLKNYRVIPLKDAGPAGLKNAEAKYVEIQHHMLDDL